MKEVVHDFEQYFWTLKSLFPGDSEFTLEKFPELPWAYVVIAVTRAYRQHQQRLHEVERPVAQLTSLMANLNRDPKKSKPYSLLDFCLYKPANSEESADGCYGAAALSLVKSGNMPSWALFCFTELTAGAEQGYEPETCAFIAEDAMLLHPMASKEGWTGLLIAQESAGDKYRDFVDDHGNVYNLRVPRVHTKVIAEEGVTLRS